MTRSPHCRFQRKYPVAIRLDGKALLRLEEIIRPLAAEIDYRATVSDGTRLKFTDVDELIAFENRKERALQSLTISGTDYSGDARNYAQVDFDTVTEFKHALDVTLDGDDDVISIIKRELDTWISDVEQGRLYTMFARQSSISFGLWILVVTIGAGAAVLLARSIARNGLALSEPEHPSNTQSTMLGVLLSLGTGIALFSGCSWVLNKVRARYWPVVVFLTGQGKRRYDESVSTRNMWLLGILVPVLLAVVGLAKC